MDFESVRLKARERLLAERTAGGWWTGELSSSALSTATSIVALTLVEAHRERIRRGVTWLAGQQNPDGGWGDTDRSFSNLSTTLLSWSALKLARHPDRAALERAERWIGERAGDLDPETLVRKVTERYGRDRTFAVPILMMCAICGTLGEPDAAWRRVLPLPFELAAFPREWFAALRLPVVSYALPALIAIGYARHHHAPAPVPLRWVRSMIWPRVSGLLERIQPGSGGFLEAAPLTGFVTMALASAGEKDHPVARRGVGFLVEGQREDGSWPIDTNLSTWVTTLAVKALWREEPCTVEESDGVLSWLRAQQYVRVHPFTNAAPGGWAWTNLSGGVPDADDTPGALLALRLLDPGAREAAEAGIGWLLDLQNSNGGIPTFCRGWGALPFDRSSADLTAHALRAWAVWREEVADELRERIDRAAARAMAFLARQQRSDGSWVPLWFGNQHVTDEENPVYGTAKVVLALNEVRDWLPEGEVLRKGGVAWLETAQRGDGSFGGDGSDSGPGSIEETALATEALIRAGRLDAGGRGLEALGKLTEGGTAFSASPIGFYFAKLWYYERLYPLIWTVSAFEAGKADGLDSRFT